MDDQTLIEEQRPKVVSISQGVGFNSPVAGIAGGAMDIDRYYQRREALAMAIRASRSPETVEDIIDRSRVFEAYLRGD